MLAKYICSGMVLLSVSAIAEAETSHGARAINLIETPDPNRDCLFFTLQGVDVAEPAVSNSDPFFSVPRSHPGFKEIYAAVLIARTTGALLTVVTTGSAESACGNHPGTYTVVIHP
jgi:hypothetical protein